MKIEDIKRDREAGTPGEWVKMAQDIYSPAIANRGNTGMVADVTLCDEWEHNARRIARVPELEAALLEAVEVIEAAKSLRLAIRHAGLKRTPGVYQAVMHYDAVAKPFLERFK